VASGRKLLGLGAVATALAAVVVIVVVTGGGGSNAGAKASSAPSGSATVERRDLISTDTESGTLSYADPRTVFNRVSGTVTWLPAIGQVIKPGQTLYEINNSPVVLFNGSTPAFRDLSPSVSAGPDVLELNRDLLAMGFAAPGSITAEDTWQAGTTTAVERWQASLGETETGTISLGQVVFLPGSRRVTALDTVVGSNGSGGGTGSGSSSAASASVTPKPVFVSLTKTSTRRTGKTPAGSGTTGSGPGRRQPHTGLSGSDAQLLRSIERLLQAQAAELRALAAAGSRGAGARSSGGSNGSGSGSTPSASASGRGSGAGGAGSGGGAATAIMSTSSTKLIVTVDLDASKQAEAVVGAPVTVQLPTGSTVNGRVTAVSPVAQSSSSGTSGSGSSGSGSGGGGSGASIPVTITVSGHLPSTGLDQAAVSVNFEQQVERNVLSVPVTALLATQGGGYAVQEALAPHRLIPVTPGLFAAGYVQVSGTGIQPGLEITDSQG
jgi:hypothetical protein